MKNKLMTLILLFTAVNLLAQTPVVSNVRLEQRTDGTLMADIWYDLTVSDEISENYMINVEASDDNGATWDLNCTSLTGNVGGMIVPGMDYHIVWDFYTDNPNVSGDQYKVRVIANLDKMVGNDGMVYQTVKIGNQWWMAENLKETLYRNGVAIPEVTDDGVWGGLSTGARCAYENNETYADIYGYLYNNYVLTNSNQIAPAGWHVATDEEWKELEMFLGMNQLDADAINRYRGTYEGHKLKSTNGWINNGNGSNTSGFSALPGGYRYEDGHFFVSGGILGDFWTNGERLICRTLHYTSSDIARYSNSKRVGSSVRLVRD